MPQTTQPTKRLRPSDSVASATVDILKNDSGWQCVADARLKIKAGARNTIEYTRDMDLVDESIGRKPHLFFQLSNLVTMKYRQQNNRVTLSLNTVNPNELNVQNHNMNSPGLDQTIPTSRSWIFETDDTKAGYSYNVVARCREAGAHDGRIIEITNVPFGWVQQDVEVCFRSSEGI